MNRLIILVYLFFSLDAATDYLLNNPVSLPSGSKSLAPAQLAPSTSLAPEFSLTMLSSSDNEQEELSFVREWINEIISKSHQSN